MLTHQITQAVQDWILAAPVSPSPSPAPGAGFTVNTAGFITFIIGQILPIPLAILGVTFLFRARTGRMGEVMSSGAIGIVGLAVIAGAGGLWFGGAEWVVNLFFSDK